MVLSLAESDKIQIQDVQLREKLERALVQLEPSYQLKSVVVFGDLSRVQSYISFYLKTNWKYQNLNLGSSSASQAYVHSLIYDLALKETTSLFHYVPNW